MIKENDIRKSKLPAEGKESPSLNLESLDFRAKSENEVIKVPKCTYSNDIKTQSTFYFCQCSAEDFYPICSACAESCHKVHSPALKLDGRYICNCGKGNHVITKENETRYNDKKSNVQNQCFYGKFFEITPNRGYFQMSNNKFVCSVCLEWCFKKKFDDNDVVPCAETELTCECEHHYEMNIINLNVDLLSKPKFHHNLQNFNYNILSKIPATKHMYIDYLLSKISTYASNQSYEQSKVFFSNFINLKILELFSAFAVRWENKFFHIKNYFVNFHDDVLIKLMSFNEYQSMQSSSDAGEYCSAKFYFAEMIFNFMIRSYQLKYNNLWNIRTILNMNLYQRFIYLQQIRNFFKFNSLAESEMVSRENTFNELSTAILELYDNILKLNENFAFTDRIMSYVFPTFNRIIKYLIKYNLINDEHKAKYFELVLDTINLKSTNNFCESFYIIKSILYTLIYRNDRICLNYIKQTKDENNKKFVFEKNRESDNTCKIFVAVITQFERADDFNRSIIYDFYVRKIFELMIGKGDFYIKNLRNLHFISDTELGIFKSEDVQTEIKATLNMTYLGELNSFANKMNHVNREYFDYDLPYETYLTQVNEIFKVLRTFLQNEIHFNHNLKTQHYIFLDGLKDEILEQKISEIQNCVRYSLFFQKIEEFLQIYSEGKTYIFKNGEPLITFEAEVQNEYLEVILNFLYLIFHKNYPNLCLVMNIKPKIFVGSFIDISQKLFLFLERMSEMIYSNYEDYQFDNIYFLSEVLSEIITLVLKQLSNMRELTEEKTLTCLYNIHKVMRISIKSINSISMHHPDFLNCIEKIKEVLQKIKMENDLNALIDEYFFQNAKIIIKRKENQPLSVIEQFITSYFLYVNELIANDVYFFGYLSDDDYLIATDTVGYILSQLYHPTESDIQNFPIEMEYQMTRFFLLNKISLKFKTTTIDTQITNMFMKNIPKEILNISLTHLAKTPDEDKPEVEELISQATLMITIFKNFQKLFQKVFNFSQIEFEDILAKRTFLLKYNEHILIRPSFTLVNYFLLHSSLLKGGDCLVIYELCFYLLKNLIYFYQNLEKINGNPTGSDGQNELKSEEIYDYENISIKSHIDASDMNEIFDDLTKLATNAIKYFQLDKIYEIYSSTIQKTLKLKQKIETEGTLKKTGNKSLVGSILAGKLNYVNKACYLRMEKLVNKYQARVRETYDDKLSMISVLDQGEGEGEGEVIGQEFYIYLMGKLCDTLSDSNIYSVRVIPYKSGSISDLGVNKLKLQNSYVLLYLNALFYHDSERFQKILESNIGDENYQIFFDFLTKYLIYPCTLNEIRKIYEIDPLAEEDTNTGIKYIGRKESLSFEICTTAIKLLQNLCESHNQAFQDKFFSYNYDIKDNEYKYKDFLVALLADNFSKQRSCVNRKFSIACVTNEIKRDLETAVRNENAMLIRPMLSSDGERMTLGQKEYLAQTREKEKQEMHNLEEKFTSFFNFILHNMRIINKNLNVESSFQSKLFSLAKNYKNYENALAIYQRYSDLIVEMIQGTSCKNFDNFYKKLPESMTIFDESGKIANRNTLNSFAFVHKCIEIQTLLFDPLCTFNSLSLPMKYNLFVVITNVINQELADTSIVKMFLVIFPPEKVIDVISCYVRGLIIKHIRLVDYEDSEFLTLFEDLELNNEIFIDLKYQFKNQMKIYEDEYFKLAAQMYLYMTILGEKYHISDAERVLQLDKKEIIVSPEENEEEGADTPLSSRLFTLVKQFVSTENNQKDNKKKAIKHNINNMIISAKFFNKIIKNCEFMIDSSNDEGDELKLKLIYFIVDPRVFFISKRNFDTFFDEVDRSSSTTKLKSLIDRLNFFMWEVEYKSAHLKDNNYLKWMLETDYKNVDLMNFCISLAINLILLMFLTADASTRDSVYYLTAGLAIFQILLNILYLIIFLLSKYNFYVLLSKSENEDKRITPMDWLKIHVLDSFLFNDEIYLMILIIIMGTLGILSNYGSFLFSLQLLTVIKFVGTIKEIVIAFQLRFSQLISMIGFLAILIFFYANIGFYFLSKEFQTTIDDQKENLCATLLECVITYFNHGVRSGGGIGDILEGKSFTNMSMYWARWITDMVFYITVILLLLNMINGVIVSTFSQIREESNEKEEDINNKCFICNIDRVEFEKRKIAFKDHQKYEHNVKTFIRFLIYIKLLSEKDLDADQSFIIGCIKERDISCFPVLVANSIGPLDQQEKDEEDEDEDD